MKEGAGRSAPIAAEAPSTPTAGHTPAHDPAFMARLEAVVRVAADHGHLWQHAYPDLHAALQADALSAGLAGRIEALLAAPPSRLLNAATTVEGATGQFVRAMNHELGRLARTPDELAELTPLVGSGSVGSLGEWFAHFNLLDDAGRAGSARHPSFAQADIPELSVDPFLPDQLHPGAQQTLDLKTGYHGGTPDSAQVLNYDILVGASRTDPTVATAVGGTVDDAGAVTQGLQRHSWLFQPSTGEAVTYLGRSMEASRPAAARMFRMLERLSDQLDYAQAVYYLDRSGNIQRVLAVGDDGVMGARTVGTTITDLLADVP